MVEAGSVSALLKLDASGFDSSMTKSIEKITSFAKTMEKVGKDSTNFTNGLQKVTTQVENLRTQLQALDRISTFENFNRLSTAMSKLVDSAIRFNKEGGVTVTTFTQLGNGIRSFMNALGGVDIKLTNVVNAEERLTASSSQLELALARVGANLGTGYGNYISQINQVNDALTRMRATMGNGYGNYLANINQVQAALNRTKTSTDTVSTSTKTMSNSFGTAGSRASSLKSNVGGLTQSLSALRGVVSMVGSMFLYSFAHNMLISVQNTIKAKSEMTSFLHTMGMSSGQIDSFNAALDRTAERFQRINKYNIGETVANIGLEFDLSAQEMEKAMNVTSMVTSEYLRAGRNADEAALAVKDILQGQFQRLSRETGVKGEQLKEAGWSGDPEDVMGLLDALEKVGQSRHWDTFAEKASSLNDILLITQNRFSEWATDMSEGVTPLITEAFNGLIMMVDNVTAVLGGIGNALNLPDWAGTAVIITGVVTAFGALFTSTIRARTGLGLLDIAHKGLGQSIIATLFNIKAEELEYQKASTIALGRILGLNNEVVARNGLTAAIKADIGMQQAENIAKQEGMLTSTENVAKIQLETWAKQQNIGETERKILTDRLEAAQSLSTGEAIMTKVFALDAEIVKEHGIWAALGASRSARIADQIATEGETVAEETLNSARVIGIATMGAYLAALLAIAAVAAVFLVPMIQQTMEATETMKTFNEFVREGDNVLKDASSTVERYKNKISELEQKQASLTEGSAEYEEVTRELKIATDSLNVAQGDLTEKTKDLEQARSGLAHHQEKMTDLAIEEEKSLRDQLHRTGMAYEEAEEKARNFHDAVGKGLSALHDIENYKSYSIQRAEAQSGIIKEQFGDTPEAWKRIEEKYKIQGELAEQWERMQKAESLTEKADAWLQFEWFQGVNWVDDFKNAWDSQDWDSIWPHIEDTLKMALPGLTTLGGILDLSGISDAIQSGMDSLDGVLDGLFDGIWNTISKPFVDTDYGKIVSDWWNGLSEAFSNLFSGGEGGGGGLLPQKMDTSWLLNGLFGAIDINGASEWFNNSVITPLSEAFNNFLSDPISALMLTIGDFGIFNLIDKIFGMESGSDQAMSWSYAWVELHIAQPLRDALTNLPTTVMTLLTNTVNVFMQFANQLLQQGVSAGSNFLNGVVSFISQLPSRVYSYITSTASNIISGASQWVSNARSKASETVNAVITQVSQLPDKVYNEFMKIANRIRDAISAAVQAATQFGSDIVNAVLGALHIASPGIIQEKIATEFANIGGRIAETREDAQNEASLYGQSIVDGMDTQIANIQASASMYSTAMAQVQPMTDGSFVESYESDAYALYGINQTMATDTSMTFGLMGDTVNSTISGISLNMQTSFTDMNTTQTTALTTMQNQNRTAYTNLQNQTTTSLNNMRSTTQNVTVQMINAWSHMKDSIISSADQLKTQSTAHFNTLSSNIGSFYQKLQNPSMWGAGDKVPTRYYNHSRGQRGIRAVKQVFGVTPNSGVAGGPMQGLPQRTSLRNLRSIIGSPFLFRGMDLDQEVDVAQFLSMFDGAFGWNDWHNPHFEHIKSTTGEWDMRGPMIMHRIDTGTAFKVKEFYNSQPQISFASFQKMAEALFSAIPYDYYFDSSKYGSWQAALQAGSCNCYDGANALVALASTCGFSGHIEHGTWNGIGHVYAVIEGKKMDTTGWQQRRDWNGVSAGSPPNMRSGESKTYNITIDMNNATFYGEDDFRSKMEDIAEEVLRKEVNTSITVGI